MKKLLEEMLEKLKGASTETDFKELLDSLREGVKDINKELYKTIGETEDNGKCDCLKCQLMPTIVNHCKMIFEKEIKDNEENRKNAYAIKDPKNHRNFIAMDYLRNVKELEEALRNICTSITMKMSFEHFEEKKKNEN